VVKGARASRPHQVGTTLHMPWLGIAIRVNRLRVLYCYGKRILRVS
jgi:hypothetical protein